jgi:peptidoglycan hydrolase-like protein with peptidoglycan-binding domain
MPQFNGQNNKKTDPRWFLNETVEKTKLEQLEEVLTEQQVLRRGMRERDRNGPIHQLQTALKTLNLYAGEVDGVYGGGTRDAVRAFQKKQVEAGKIPAKNEKTGRSNIDGIAGPVTIAAIASASGSSGLGSVFQQLKTRFFGKEQPKTQQGTEPPKPMYGKRRVTRTDTYTRLIIKNLEGYVDAPKMNMVVKVLKRADDRGVLSRVVQRYRNKTGDGLQDTIRGVMGVHKLKNQALAILGGKAAKKDITTQLDDAVPQSLQDTVRDIYGAIPFTPWNALASVGRIGKLLKYGPPQYRVAFKFGAGSTTPFTTKDLKPSEIREFSEFMDAITNPQNPEYAKIMKRAGKFRKYFKKQAENARKKGGRFVFGNRDFGCKGKKCNNELYYAFRAINPEKDGQVNPEGTIGKLKLMMGQFVAINKGSYWLMKDDFDFNDWKALADNNAGFQAYYEKVYKSLEGTKDQIVGKKTKLGAACAKRSGKGKLYNLARCFLPIRHALMPSDKLPWETGAFSAYKGFPVILRIPRIQGQPKKT